MCIRDSDAGFFYDGSPNGSYQRASSRDLWGFGLGFGSRLLSWKEDARPHVGTSFAELRFGAIEFGSSREFANGGGLLGAGWAWDPSHTAHGPTESLCLNNYCVRAAHFLGKGTELQVTITLPFVGLHYWSD